MLRTFSRLGTTLLIGVTLGLAAAQEPAGLALRPLNTVIEAMPREVVTVLAQIENHTETAQTPSAQLGVPVGWRVLAPPAEVTLEAGETRLITVSLLIAPDAKAGIYALTLALSSSSVDPEEALITVRVAEVRQLEISVLEAPALVFTTSYQVRYLVRNTGNVVEKIDLLGDSRSNLSLDVEPERVELSPGEYQEVTLSVTGSQGRDERQHYIQLIAQSNELTEVRAVANTPIDVALPTLNRWSGYHTFPLTVHFKAAIDTSDLSLEEMTTALGVEVTGSGKLWEDDPGRLTLQMTDSLDFESNRNFVQYRHPDFLLAFGDQGFALSPLLDGGNSFGATTSGWTRPSDDLEVEGSAVVFSTSLGAAYGVRASTEYGGYGELSTQLLTTPESTTASARARLLPGAVPVERLLLNADAEYAIRLSGGPVGRAYAARAQGSIQTEKGSVEASYERKDARFDDSSSDRVNAQGAMRLELGEALGLDERVAVDLDMHYRNAQEFVQAHGANEGWDRLTHLEVAYGAKVSVSSAPVNASLQFEQTNETEVSAHTVAEESTLTGSAGLPLGGAASLRQTLAWNQKKMQNGVENYRRHELSYLAEGKLPTGFQGSLTPAFGVTYDLNEKTLVQLELSVNWSGTPTPRLQVLMGSELHLLGSELVDFTGSAGYRLTGGHRVNVELQAKAHRDRTPQATVKLGYALPLTVPVARLANVGEVSGSITNENGEGVPGVPLELAGQLVVTGENGRFHYQAIPVGEHYLQLRPGTLEPTELLLPAVPYHVDVEPGSELTVNFEVVRAARLEGTLRLSAREPAKKEGDPNQRSTIPGQIQLQGLLVELSNPMGTYRTRTNSQGAFTFTSLPPGTYQLHVQPGDWPEEYRLQIEEPLLVLQPAETEQVAVQVLFEPRTIRFIDERREPIRPR